MPIWDNSVTTSNKIASLWDNSITTSNKIIKVWENSVTTSNLVYSDAGVALYNNGTIKPWDYEYTSNEYNYVTDQGTSILFQPYNTGSSIIGWYVDLTGYSTITVTGEGDSSVDGWHGVSITANKADSGWSPSVKWSGSGTWTRDILSYSGFKYVSVGAHAFTKEGTPLGYYDFKLTSIKLS